MPAIILPFLGVMPEIAADAFIAPNATVIGRVSIGAGSSVWFNTVIRGDVSAIRIGAGTNIQDGTIVHVTENVSDVHIGDGVTIGHAAIIHGATLESGSFVGMQAVVLDNAVVEGGAMVAAGALVTPGKRIKAGELWAGRPAKYLREVRPEEREHWPIGAENYRKLGAEYVAALDK